MSEGDGIRDHCVTGVQTCALPISISQQLKQLETDKKDNTKQAADLMKQADAAQSNEEANRLNDKAVALRVANSKIDGRLQQLDFQSHKIGRASCRERV